RVTDRADSMDVIGDPAAAAIARRLPGRGLVRLGPGEIVSFQAALVSTSAAALGQVPVEIRPFRFAHEPEPVAGSSSAAGGPTDVELPTDMELPTDVELPTDLELIVSAATEAVFRIGLAPPRRPWPEPLPLHLNSDDISPSDDHPPGSVVIGLVDEPDRQRIVPFTWSPDGGSLGMYGVTGCGLTTAMHTIVLGLASGERRIPLYLIDGGGGLAPLSRLARVGAVVSPLEGERMARLVRMLLAVIDARRSGGGAIIDGDGDKVVVGIDGLEAVLRAADDSTETMVRQGLIRVIAEGNGAGIVTVFGTPRPAGLPAPVEASVANRLVFRQADPVGAAVHGIRGADCLPPGRAIHASTARTVQVAVSGPSLVAAAAAVGNGERPPPPVGTLPDFVAAAEIEHLLTVGARWTIPVGIGDGTLAPVVLTLAGGEHVLVAGGARSGRTTMLAAVASVVRHRAPQVRVVAVAPAASPLGAIDGLEAVTEAGQLADLVDGLLAGEMKGTDQALILVDDADDFPAGDLTRLVTSRRCGLHVVAAVRPEVKSVYDHWARTMAVHRLGVWLRPSAGVDADLWRTPLPRRLPVRVPPGRGLLIADGATELVQVMHP
ncbi:MAG: hypothetical protein M3349_08435, partial [Actinomycetota bacterium]|nr:hypothetical protein [Actinomycetota bacterium]